jgi:hypothetical protein
MFTVFAVASLVAAQDDFNYETESPLSNKLRICDGIVGVFIDSNQKILDGQLHFYEEVHRS